MATQTRQKIIQAANDLFYRDGFLAVGIDQIVEEAGVTKTTFYNHFDTKDELMSATLDWHDQWWQDTFRGMLKRLGGDTPKGQLLALFDAMDEIFNSPDYNGCFFINVAVQYPLPHDPAHVAAAEHKRAMEAIIRELAGYAGADDAAALAKSISLVMEGAYVTRQVTQDEHTADIGRDLVAMLVDKHLRPV